jgi:proliferating cell nuclear antigen
MILKLNEPKLLLDSISLISELVSEVKLKITRAGLNIVAVDPANVALVSLKFPAALFSELKTEEEENLGINLEDLKQVLRRADASSTLTLETEGGKLKLSIQGTVKRTFNLSLLSIESEEKRIPELEFIGKVDINSEIFSNAIEDAAIISDSCSFAVKDKFIIEAKGNLHSTKTEFSSDEAKFSGEAKSKYSLEYLQKFIKARRFAERVSLQFSNDYPARLDFKGPVEMTFILAPRVEEE